MSARQARIPREVKMRTIVTGPELLAAIEAGEVTHEQAHEINERLPARERVYPPDIQGWVDQHGGYWRIPWDEWDALNARYQQLRRRELKPK
jgi:hypothetical protein